MVDMVKANVADALILVVRDDDPDDFVLFCAVAFYPLCNIFARIAK